MNGNSETPKNIYVSKNVCYKEAVVEMNKLVGNDNVGVKKSPKI